MSLTQEVFTDQPDWVQYAAIDKSGDVLGFKKDPTASQDWHGWIVVPFWNPSIIISEDQHDGSNWQHSVIKRAPVLVVSQ